MLNLSFFVILHWIILPNSIYGHTNTALMANSSNHTNLPPSCSYESTAEEPTLVCHLQEEDVGQVIEKLPTDIQRLRFVLYSNWSGVLPKPQEIVNISSICTFSHLKYLAFQSSTAGNERMITTSISFDVDTFKNITDLHTLIINIPLFDQTFTDMVKYFENLETLDLSETKFLSFSSVDETIRALPSPETLKELKLRRFQNIGSMGYSQVVNISYLCSGFSQLEELDLSKNSFGIIIPGLIATLPKLRRLDISYNSFAGSASDAIYWDIILHTNLEYVDLSNQINSELLENDIKKGHTNQLAYTKSKNQAFESIAVQCANLVDGGNVSKLLHNTTLFCYMSRCMVKYAFNFKYFEEIPCKAFDLVAFDFQCYLFLRAPFFLNLQTLRADNLNWIITFSYSVHGTVCVHENTSLSHISFADNKRWIGAFRFSESINNIDFSGANNVTSMDFSNNGLSLKLPTTNNIYPNLKQYNLAGNEVQLENRSLCKYWPNLQNFNLSSNKIKYLYVNIFEDCHHIEVLDLSHNKFTTLAIMLMGLSSLQYFDIGNNLLSFLPNHVTQYLDRRSEYRKHTHKTVLNAVGNPYICNCSADSLDFVNWFNKNESTHVKNRDTMFCSGYKGRKLIQNVNVAEMEGFCNASDIPMLIITVLATLGILFFFTLLGVIYRFRWKIRFQIQKKSLRRRPMTMNEIDGIDYEYDAFVIYCAADRFWVHDALMKTLENEYGFMLCIHYRDFPVGGLVMDAIVKKMKASKQFIIIVSESSIKTPWVSFELQVAYSEARNRRANVILIKLENITQPVDSPALLWILENNVHLEWSNDEDGKKLFWNKLVSSLYGDESGGCCCCCKFGIKAVRPEQLGRGIADEAREGENEPLLP